jgi:hypothetical protein
LQAIRHSEVDALVVSGPAGPQVYTLQSADHPYRILVQEMQEGALTLASTGLILYANLAFARMGRVWEGQALVLGLCRSQQRHC